MGRLPCGLRAAWSWLLLGPVAGGGLAGAELRLMVLAAYEQLRARSREIEDLKSQF